MLRALSDLREELGEVRIGLGDARGEQGRRLDALTGAVETLGREVRRQAAELPAQIIAGVLAGFERSAYAPCRQR